LTPAFLGSNPSAPAIILNKEEIYYMESQKELIAMTQDSIFIACECGCKIFRLYDLAEDRYYIEIYQDSSHKSMTKKDRRRISEIPITKKDLKNLLWVIEEWIDARTINGLDMKLYSLKHGKEELSFVKDGTSDNLFFLNITTKRWYNKERYLADIVINIDQVKQLGVYLRKFIERV
jgi:hypothetical protein